MFGYSGFAARSPAHRIGPIILGTELGSDVEKVAATICATLKGLKDAGTDYETYSARVRVLADLFGAGLTAV